MICDRAATVVAVNDMAFHALDATVGGHAGTLFDDLGEVDNLVARAVSGISAEVAVATTAGWVGRLHLNQLTEGWAVLAVLPSGEDLRRSSALRDHEDRFQALCENAPAGIMCAETGMRIDYVNDHCATVFGVEPEDLWGFGWLDGLDGQNDVEAAVGAVERAVAGETVGPVALLVRRPDSTVRRIEVRFAPNRVGGGGFVATVEDVTDVHSFAERLERQAHQDELTGLGNRRRMVEAITASIDEIRAGRSQRASLLFLDLDNFKYVNDTLGHNAGDQLLVEVADRLVAGVRSHVDVVCRFGGDEFVILMPGNDADAADVADRLVDTIAAPYLIAGTTAAVTASVGIVVIDGLSDAEEVLRDADVAMYQAKRTGKNRAAEFSLDARTAAETHMMILSRLRDALDSHPERFSVVYQPICKLDGTPIAVEALARWTDDQLGEVTPELFITVAEMSGYATRIGELIRELAIADAAKWRKQGWDGYLSVNVSAEELTNKRLEQSLTTQLEAASFPADALCVEVTETSVMADPESAREVLDDLTAIGVSIAIDDFGTGHSSLAYLKRLPVSVLKMDREFVGGAGVEGEDRAICAAIVAMAGALGLRVVAEGVETSEQLEALNELGVYAVQGWLFSKAFPADGISALLALDLKA